MADEGKKFLDEIACGGNLYQDTAHSKAAVPAVVNAKGDVVPLNAAQTAALKAAAENNAVNEANAQMQALVDRPCPRKCRPKTSVYTVLAGPAPSGNPRLTLGTRREWWIDAEQNYDVQFFCGQSAED